MSFWTFKLLKPPKHAHAWVETLIRFLFGFQENVAKRQGKQNWTLHWEIRKLRTLFNFPTFSRETNRIWEVKQTWEWLLGWNIFLLSRALTTQTLSVWVLLSFFLSLSRVFYLYLFGIFLVVAIVRTISFTNAFSAVDRLEHPMVLTFKRVGFWPSRPSSISSVGQPGFSTESS